MEPFFREMPFQLVIFTEADSVPIFKEWRKDYIDRTLIVELPLAELNAFTKWEYEMWNDAMRKDHEMRHTSELYGIWYEKKEFILRAIEMKAFEATKFVWCDAGILRYKLWLPFIKQFPLEERIPAGKMTLLLISEFSPDDTVDTDYQYSVRVGGGILAADADTWRWWSIQYDTMMIRYQVTNRFVGKDQNLFASLCKLHPSRVNIIRPPIKPVDGTETWFWLLLYLAGF